MGETPMRLRRVTDLIVSGENKWRDGALFIGRHFNTALKEDKKYLTPANFLFFGRRGGADCPHENLIQ
jgi:hypothetical protein